MGCRKDEFPPTLARFRNGTKRPRNCKGNYRRCA